MLFMKNTDEFEYFLARVSEMEEPVERAVFAEKFLEDIKKDNLTSAQVEEFLAELYRKGGEPKAVMYQKAASSWEMVSVFEGNKNERVARDSLRQALYNYRRAAKFYRRNGEVSKSEDMSARAEVISQQLGSLSSPIRKVAITFLFVAFLFSFLFLLSPPTGLVVVDLDSEKTSIFGVVLAVIAVIGTFFLVRKR